MTAARAIAFAAAVLAFGQDRDVPIDNRFVKVVQVHRAMPGVKTRPHLHAMNRVMIYLNAGGQTISYEDGKVDKLVWKAGEVLWSPRGGMHVAEIAAGEPARIVEVELKGGAGKRLTGLPPRDPVKVDARHYALDFENDQVRVVRVKLGPGEKTPVVEHTWARVVVYLTGHDLEVTAGDGSRRRLQRSAEKVEWVEPSIESVRNAGTQATDAVVIYLKSGSGLL